MEKGKSKVVKVAMTLFLIQLTVLLLGTNVCSEEKVAPTSIRIGVNAALTGRGALWGAANVRGARVMVDRVNAGGGITVAGKKYLMELFPYDHALDPAKALENVKRMVYVNKVQFATTMNLTASLGTFPILTENRIITALVTTGKQGLDPKFQYNFRTMSDPDSSFTAIFEYAVAKGAKTFVDINADDESGWSTIPPVERSAERAGLKMVGREFYTRGTSDFYPILTKAIAKKPDLVDFGYSDPGSVAMMVKQIRELDYKGLLSSNASFLSPESLKIMGKSAVEGMITLMGVHPPVLEPEYLTPEERAFMEADIKKNGPPFEVTDYIGGTNILIILEGIKRSDSLDPDKIKTALERSEIMVFGRKANFGMAGLYGQPHQMLKDLPLYEVKEGKAKFIKWMPPLSE